LVIKGTYVVFHHPPTSIVVVAPLRPVAVVLPLVVVPFIAVEGRVLLLDRPLDWFKLADIPEN